ncbi:MAG: hypothetical protein WCI46_13825 [Verrucomicrobiota bacterium]
MKKDRFGERFGCRFKHGSSTNHLASEDAGSFLKTSPKVGGGRWGPWEFGRLEQGRNQELAERGAGRLESGGGV